MATKDYIRQRFFPHMWCQGCGHGIIMNGMIRAIESLGLDKNEIVMVSGIGCSSRMVGYVDFHTLHTLHGRALTFASGIKVSRPELTVIVPMGDGDSFNTGGNHFIHAARRNIDLTALVMNNQVFGMTGGQFSAMSGRGAGSTTTPLGNIEPSFDAVELAKAAGATFVARATTFHVNKITKYLAKAITHKGFSVVEVMTQCPTNFGRRNKQGSAVEMMERFRDLTVPVGSEKKRENPDLTEIGIFVDEQKPEYCDEYEKVVERFMKGEKK